MNNCYETLGGGGGGYCIPDPKKNWTLVFSCVDGAVNVFWRCRSDGMNYGMVKSAVGTEITPADAVREWANYIEDKSDYIRDFGEPEKEKTECINGKAVFMHDFYGDEIGFTVGKIYEFKDGRTIDDDGRMYPTLTTEPATTDDEWFTERFVLLKE